MQNPLDRNIYMAFADTLPIPQLQELKILLFLLGCYQRCQPNYNITLLEIPLRHVRKGFCIYEENIRNYVQNSLDRNSCTTFADTLPIPLLQEKENLSPKSRSILFLLGCYRKCQPNYNITLFEIPLRHLIKGICF